MKGLREFIHEEDGIGTVEMILILVVLIGIVIIFRDQIRQIVTNIMNTIKSKSESVDM